MKYRHLTKEMRALVKRELDSGKVKVEDVIHNINVEEFLSSQKSDVQIVEEKSWMWNGKIYTSTLSGELEYYIDRYSFRKNKCRCSSCEAVIFLTEDGRFFSSI